MNPLFSLALMITVGFLAAGVDCTDDYVSPNMKVQVKNLKAHYNTGDTALFGKPIFLQDLDKFEETEKKLLLQESLDVYIRILTHMENSTHNVAIEANIMALRAKMEDLQKHYFPSGELSLKKRLQELWSVETNDATTQRRALRELIPVFQEASRLGVKIHGKKESRRRRRQTQRGRIPRP